MGKFVLFGFQGVLLALFIAVENQVCATDYEDAVFAAMTKDVSANHPHPIKYDRVDINVKKSYDQNSGKFYASKKDSYWISLSGGSHTSRSNVWYAQALFRGTVQMCGLYRLVTTRSRYLNGQNTHSRDIIVNMEALQTLHVSNSWPLHSDPGAQTSLTIFRLGNLMNSTVYFSAGTSKDMAVTDGDTMSFDRVFVNVGKYFILTSYFIAPIDGLYFFSFSFGSRYGKPFDTSLRINSEIFARLVRTYDVQSDYDSTSRAGIFRLQKDDTVSVRVDQSFHLWSTSGEFETSFSGFLYDPNHGRKVGWAVAKHTGWSGSTFLAPVPFEEVLVNEGGGWNRKKDRFFAPISGLYYITLAVGSMSGKPVHVGVYVDLAKKVSLKRLASLHNGNDIASRSAIIQVTEGDAVYLGAEANTGIYSTFTHRETMFSGFLLFPYGD